VLCFFTGYMCLYLFTSPTNLPAGDETIIIGVADRIAHHGFSHFTPQEVFARAVVKIEFFLCMVSLISRSVSMDWVNHY